MSARIIGREQKQQQTILSNVPMRNSHVCFFAN
jgi:hypothetical protein